MRLSWLHIAKDDKLKQSLIRAVWLGFAVATIGLLSVVYVVTSGANPGMGLLIVPVLLLVGLVFTFAGGVSGLVLSLLFWKQLSLGQRATYSLLGTALLMLSIYVLSAW